jgi:two-component system sensor histidine kinase YesM
MIHFINRIYRQWLYNLKLRHKILLTYLVLIVCPLCIFQVVASDKVSNIITSHVTYSAEQGFDQTYSFLSYRLQRVADTTDVMIFNPLVLDILTNTSRLDDISRQIKDYGELKQLMKSLQDGVDISRILLYVQQAYIFSNESENFLPMDQPPISPCLNRLKSENAKYLWCSPAEMNEKQKDSSTFLYVVRSIKDPNNYLETVGQLRVNVNADTLRSILTKANVVKKSVTYLRSNDNQIVLSSDPIVPPQVAFPESTLNLDKISFNSDGNYYLIRPIPASNWSMVTAIPLDEIVNQTRQLRNDMLILLAIIASGAYVIAYILAVSITRRISQLTRRLKGIQEGNLIPLAQTQGKDEIGELIRTYNFMLEQITHMNKEQYKLGQEVKSAELKALQSQINPHFLYNTLDLINWMTDFEMKDEVKKVVKALARFYKISLSNGKDIITIQEELDHVAFYVQIQNIRFENKIGFDINVDEAILSCTIPKITLQPIVENAILHGILGHAHREGRITLTGTKEDGIIYLKIADNGIGMNEEQLNRIGTEQLQESQTGSGYGSSNVNQRIQHYFGNSYGLTYYSEIGKGTTVEIRIPAVAVGEAT